MENSITVNFTPLQMLLSLALQVWIIVFPILVIRKLNYLTALVEEHLNSKNESES